SRIHFVGSVDDPTPYLQAADLYLESFPFGSQTALLEAALAALPIVRACSSGFPLLAASDDTLDELLPIPQEPDEYVSMANDLLQDSERRQDLGRECRSRVVQSHVGEGWRERVYQLYSVLLEGTHNPRSYPPTISERQIADVALCTWQQARESVSIEAKAG